MYSSSKLFKQTNELEYSNFLNKPMKMVGPTENETVGLRCQQKHMGVSKFWVILDV